MGEKMKENMIAQRSNEILKLQQNGSSVADSISKPTGRSDIYDIEQSYGVQNLPSDNINQVLSNKYQTEFVERQQEVEKLRNFERQKQMKKFAPKQTRTSQIRELNMKKYA